MKINVIKEKGTVRVAETGDYFFNLPAGEAGDKRIKIHLSRKGVKVDEINHINL